MMNLFLIAIGGFLGAISRSFISQMLNHKFPSMIYLGTFVVNITGSFLLGLLVNIHLSTSINLFFGIGFLGAFTTFSTFKIENITLLQSYKIKHFIFYLAITYTFGILFAFLGFWFATSIRL